jgi:uncharacterized membrane protein YgaE (UPF0421/DUF939 family)
MDAREAVAGRWLEENPIACATRVSWQRLVGTALGAAVAALVGSLFGSSLLVFAASIFALGLLCAITRSDRSAYRFAGVTLAVVLLPRANPTWQIAVHRFAEVSVGITVALILAMVWPDREEG